MRGPRNHSSPTEISRLDILVHPEDVFWIVFGLDFAELCIVAAIRARKALAILIRQKIHVSRARCVGACRVVEFSRPTAAASIVPSLLPAGMNIHDKVRITTRK